MRINSLFEHDASMRRQVEGSSVNTSNNNNNNNAMPGTIYEDVATGSGSGSVSVGDVQEIPAPKGAGKNEKGEKGRHRASIACASCRDRRIRVSYRNLTI